MSLRDRWSKLMSSGPPLRLDENEPVEIATVALAIGPTMVNRLRERQFDAHGHEAFNIVTKVDSDYRIVVPRRQADDALHALDELL